MRKPSKLRFKNFTQAELAAIFERQRLKKADEKRAGKIKKIVSAFRPRKKERGSVVILDSKGARQAGNRGKVGYAVYVQRDGKKVVVRQYDRLKAKVEKYPKARRVSEIDVSRVRSKRAKKRFLEAHTSEISRGAAIEKSRYGFRRKFRRIDIASGFAEFAARELLRILRGIRSTDRNLALEIGIYAETPDGIKFFETQISTLPGDLRKAKISSISVERIREFFGRQVYAFIASEIASHGYVLAGSAQFVRNLPENRGKSRRRWTKGGHSWGGIGKKEITIKSVEWRFLQQTFTQA